MPPETETTSICHALNRKGRIAVRCRFYATEQVLVDWPGKLLLPTKLLKSTNCRSCFDVRKSVVPLFVGDTPRELHEDSYSFSFPSGENRVPFRPAMAGLMFEPCGES